VRKVHSIKDKKINEYIECIKCDFVLRSTSSVEPIPLADDSYPNCGGAEFKFIGK
jgi:hypothetical protein